MSHYPPWAPTPSPYSSTVRPGRFVWIEDPPAPTPPIYHPTPLYTDPAAYPRYPTYPPSFDPRDPRAFLEPPPYTPENPAPSRYTPDSYARRYPHYSQRRERDLDRRWWESWLIKKKRKKILRATAHNCRKSWFIIWEFSYNFCQLRLVILPKKNKVRPLIFRILNEKIRVRFLTILTTQRPSHTSTLTTTKIQQLLTLLCTFLAELLTCVASWATIPSKWSDLTVRRESLEVNMSFYVNHIETTKIFDKDRRDPNEVARRYNWLREISPKTRGGKWRGPKSITLRLKESLGLEVSLNWKQ